MTIPPLFDPVPPGAQRTRRPLRRHRSSNRRTLEIPKIVRLSDLVPDDNPRPCHVYLLVHRHDARFKIGVSICPSQRLLNLPEAGQIDETQSMTLCLPSERRAHRLEKLLHRALEDFRLSLTYRSGEIPDGGTEWFHLDGFLHAVSLLRHLPKGRGQETLRLQHLDGRPVDESECFWMGLATERQLRMETAARQNALQMREIRQYLKAVAPYCDVVRQAPTKAGTDVLGRPIAAQPERVVIRGLRDLWEPGTIGARFALSASPTWMFQSGRGRAREERKSMVTLIRFCTDQPRDLEMHILDRAVIRQWPGAALMLRVWDERLGG